MKREIKFRGWFQGINGTEMWVYGYLVKQTNGHWEITNGERSWTVDNVGQFTGLKDKNGVEIYEGDIVRYYQPYSKTFHTHIVRWDDIFACFGLFKQDSKWCVESDWLKIKEIEVVGNIYYNPELLK